MESGDSSLATLYQSDNKGIFELYHTRPFFGVIFFLKFKRLFECL